jgi:hypothetical protein
MANLEFTFVISPDDVEPYRVTARSRDVAHWERTFKGASIDKLQSAPSVNDLEQLAWVTANRRGKFDDNLNMFRETCDFDMLDPNEANDDEAGPTHAAR